MNADKHAMEELFRGDIPWGEIKNLKVIILLEVIQPVMATIEFLFRGILQRLFVVLSSSRNDTIKQLSPV